MKFSVISTITMVSSVKGFTPQNSALRFVTKSQESTQLNLFKSSGPAKSSEEDLELTRKIIMGHVGSIGNEDVEDKKVEEVVELSPSDGEEEESSDETSRRTKIKKKVMNVVDKVKSLKK